MLIFDEVISGFRVGFEGAAAYYNISRILLLMVRSLAAVCRLALTAHRQK
jgi:glutamate-1-semialdehyde aminotransferase